MRSNKLKVTCVIYKAFFTLLVFFLVGIAAIAQTITGSAVACTTDEPQFYSIRDLPVKSGSCNITWTVTGGYIEFTNDKSTTYSENIIVGSSGIWVKWTSTDGKGSIKLTGCNSDTYSKAVTVGNVPLNVSVSKNGDTFTLTASGAQNYEWHTRETTQSIKITTTSEVSYSVTGQIYIGKYCSQTFSGKVTGTGGSTGGSTPTDMDKFGGNVITFKTPTVGGMIPSTLGQDLDYPIPTGRQVSRYEWQRSLKGLEPSTFQWIYEAGTYKRVSGESFTPPVSTQENVWYRRIAFYSDGTHSYSNKLHIKSFFDSGIVGVTSYITSTEVRAKNNLTIQGTQTLSANVKLNLIAENAITVLPSTILSPGTRVVAIPQGQELRQSQYTFSSDSTNAQNINQASSFNSYPNPADDVIYVSAIDDQFVGTVEYKLFDSQGKLRKSTKTRSSKVSIQTADLPEGLYYLHIWDGKKVKKSQIIIKH